jgi:glutamate-1-semialdehyde 2,1-aminomutase
MLVSAAAVLPAASRPRARGTAETVDETLVAPLDDEPALERVFDACGSELAAVIVEPLPANHGVRPQREEWLRHVAACCRDAGTLLILTR